ncbi:phage minor head protein [Stenotrophomonas sp. MMGLT7]|uniref:phage head morphogenesis protein n=1 Tax=Stenotrophomonas sp. MMGLT7 TaxID=2901227 RepID=UPI001E48F685|nr:phage minor head protein [Stenotrophomonas sp. MMGLT7]MCD7099110.1 minor capsid protein [Stenotrophomonas sp. MMGLT7]
MSALARFDLPPAEAIRFFRRKGLRTSFAWQDLWKEEHEIGFTVAKMADLDLLSDVRDAVDQALAEGTTLRQFKELLIPKMVRAGWWGEQEQVDPQTGRKQLVQLGSPRRLDTIFLTNMGQAYSAGEWSQIEEAANDAPYLMYDAVDDNRTREQHRAWDGTVLLVSDPWWDTHRPLNGYRCRCSTIQLSARDLRAMGRSGPDQAPPIKRREWLNKRTGEVMQIPLGIDPGFDYNPGAKAGERKQRLDAMLDEKRQALRGDAP